MAAPRTARERVREEVTREILAVARTHLARDGAAALSLRSIARDLEMAPSALYRYFDGRDVLLSALIIEAYVSLAEQTEKASAAARARGETDTAWWMAAPRAMRSWALARPYEWGLIFGSPVPGYQAPEETVAPYVRVTTALLRPVTTAYAQGRLQVVLAPPPAPAAMEAALAPVRDALFPDGPVAIVQWALSAWAALIGVVSLEVFGHWRNTVLDPALFFEQSLRDVARQVGLAP
jgi:AcrR family transcriptional regulator